MKLVESNEYEVLKSETRKILEDKSDPKSKSEIKINKEIDVLLRKLAVNKKYLEYK